MTFNPGQAELEIDIPCDPTQFDQTGLPWAFLDESYHPELTVSSVARELGIPAILSVSAITTVGDGTMLHVDGDAGTVRVG